MELEGFRPELPNTRDSGLMYSIAAILFVFAGGRIARLGLPFDLYIILSEVLLIALPPVLLARARNLHIASTFRLKRPRAIDVLLTVLLGPLVIIAGACAGMIALILIRNVFGSLSLNPTDITSTMKGGVLWSLFLIAVVPAICEEMLFRGLIQRGLEKMGIGWSIALSGLLFGLFHFDFQRFAAQTLIGMVAAYVVYRTGSIVNGMILHFMHNGLLTLLMSLYTHGMPNPMPQPVTDPFSTSEFTELAERYGMSQDELLNNAILDLSLVFLVCLFFMFGLLLALRAATKNRMEQIEREEKASRGLWMGVPGLVLILTVYVSIGLTLMGHPVGKQILRFLGL